MEVSPYLGNLTTISFALSAFYWLRASKVTLFVSGAIGGPIFPLLTWGEKFVSLFYSTRSISNKCFALSAWLNSVAAFCACIGSISTAIHSF